MTDQKNPEGTGYERLKASKSLGEILTTAMSFEQAAHRFYEELAGRVGKPLRGLVKELAEEEAHHYALFKELQEQEEVQAQVRDRIRTPENDHRFSDYVHLPDLGDQPDDQAVLQYAMGREHAAMEQYAALAEGAPEGPARDLFRFLAREEQEHKAELEKKYYDLVYSTNV